MENPHVEDLLLDNPPHAFQQIVRAQRLHGRRRRCVRSCQTNAEYIKGLESCAKTQISFVLNLLFIKWRNQLLYWVIVGWLLNCIIGIYLFFSFDYLQFLEIIVSTFLYRVKLEIHASAKLSYELFEKTRLKDNILIIVLEVLMMIIFVEAFLESFNLGICLIWLGFLVTFTYLGIFFSCLVAYLILILICSIPYFLISPCVPRRYCIGEERNVLPRHRILRPNSILASFQFDSFFHFNYLPIPVRQIGPRYGNPNRRQEIDSDGFIDRNVQRRASAAADPQDIEQNRNQQLDFVNSPNNMFQRRRNNRRRLSILGRNRNQNQNYHPNQKVMLIKFPDSMKSEFSERFQCTMCSICFMEFKSSEEIVLLNCITPHLFHEECLLEWMSYEKICPVCRKPIKVNLVGISNSLMDNSNNEVPSQSFQRLIRDPNRNRNRSLVNVLDDGDNDLLSVNSGTIVDSFILYRAMNIPQIGSLRESMLLHSESQDIQANQEGPEEENKQNPNQVEDPDFNRIGETSQENIHVNVREERKSEGSLNITVSSQLPGLVEEEKKGTPNELSHQNNISPTLLTNLQRSIISSMSEVPQPEQLKKSLKKIHENRDFIETIVFKEFQFLEAISARINTHFLNSNFKMKKIIWAFIAILCYNIFQAVLQTKYLQSIYCSIMISQFLTLLIIGNCISLFFSSNSNHNEKYGTIYHLFDRVCLLFYNLFLIGYNIYLICIISTTELLFSFHDAPGLNGCFLASLLFLIILFMINKFLQIVGLCITAIIFPILLFPVFLLYPCKRKKNYSQDQNNLNSESEVLL